MGLTGRTTLYRYKSLIVLLAILVGVAIGVLVFSGHTNVERAESKIHRINNALQLFHFDMGRFPTTNEGLSALIKAPANAPDWAGPYLADTNALTDPWGRDFKYEAPDKAEDPRVFSYGRDGAPGGSGQDADVGT